MKPKKQADKTKQRHLFRVELPQILDSDHTLVKLAKTIDWDQLEEVFVSVYCANKGRPATSTRLMLALHYLKYSYNISDEEVISRWVENPYWQYFSGMGWFEHKEPVHPSSMSRWRKRIRDAGAGRVLRETIEADLELPV
jgi:IS5 family transposase